MRLIQVEFCFKLIRHHLCAKYVGGDKVDLFAHRVIPFVLYANVIL